MMTGWIVQFKALEAYTICTGDMLGPHDFRDLGHRIENGRRRFPAIHASLAKARRVARSFAADNPWARTRIREA